MQILFVIVVPPPFPLLANRVSAAGFGLCKVFSAGGQWEEGSAWKAADHQEQAQASSSSKKTAQSDNPHQFQAQAKAGNPK